MLFFAVEDDAHCGVEVIGYRGHGWDRRQEALAKLAAAHLNVPPAAALSALRGAIPPA